MALTGSATPAQSTAGTTYLLRQPVQAVAGTVAVRCEGVWPSSFAEGQIPHDNATLQTP
jgi:hypothetical protein